MEVVVMVAQIILSLSILVGVHEMGHLLAAKYFGMRVEQFSIGFPPKLFRFMYKGTEYALSAVPLGGYVKISGMIDESMDTEAMKEEPKPWEFRSKPAWQRLIVMLGGIIVNVVVGVVIFILLTFFLGETWLPKDKVNENGGIFAYELAQEIGLQTGDRVTMINGADYEDFSDLRNPKYLLEDNATYTVERDGETIEIPIPKDFITRFRKKDILFVSPRYQPVLGKIQENTLATRLGLQEGDKLTEVNGTPVQYHDQVISIVKNRTVDSIQFVLNRGDEVLQFNEYLDKDSIIGFSPSGAKMLSFAKTREFTFLQSIPHGTNEAFGTLVLQVKAFGKMFSGDLDPRKSVAGPIGIAQAFGGDWNWVRFWNLTGLLSLILAFMNLLPIPALDGGHVMFLSAEMISGRKPSDRFMEWAQRIGMLILLLLMVFIFGNDIYNAIQDFLNRG